jgi:hypothetical protein
MAGEQVSRYTFDKTSVDRIARAVRWVEDFQMDEGVHEPSFGQHPTFETPMGSEEETAEQQTLRIIRDVQLTSSGLVFTYQEVTCPYFEFGESSTITINTTNCE